MGGGRGWGVNRAETSPLVSAPCLELRIMSSLFCQLEFAI
jgi:hypothetical protein